MSQKILLLDYEPRTILRVTESLAPLGYEVVTSKDVDSAVSACAAMEPRLVLITSVLPRLKVEDAITQLRARAGLRNTPFLVLMSGYSGQDPIEDAARLGAQGILTKPFSNEELADRVKSLAQRSRSDTEISPDTRADVLEALRRSAGLSSGPGTLTSKELFGDLIEEGEPNPHDTQRIAIKPETHHLPAPTPAKKSSPSVEQRITDADLTPARPTPPPQRPAPEPAPVITQPVQAVTPVPQPAQESKPDTAINKMLDTTLAEGRERSRIQKSIEDTGGASVDELLSQTLSGLDVRIPRRTPRPPETAQPLTPPTQPEKPAPAPQITSETLEPAPKPSPPRVESPRPEPPAPAAAPVFKPAPPESKPASVPPPQASAAPLAGTAFGQYDLIEPIATGGMAEVFKARMRGLEGFQKIVAIKRILPHLTDNDEFVTMFIDEAKLAAQLQHPNIIHIYDLGKLERSYYIAMEYIDGKDLRSILRMIEDRGRRLPLGLAAFIGSRLAAALDYAHRKRDLQGKEISLVHRDVSPQNVLISYDGDIKLCDFGIAKAASKASHTRAGALKGKLQYMSPEQAWGKDIDLRSDIFSLGLVLYEMLTGRKAFAGDSELSILELVRSPQIVPPRDFDPAIPPEVERIVLRALRENRDDRYQTSADMATDLGNILQALRPAPGASELGTFLGDLMGKEKLVSTPPVTAPRPAMVMPPSAAAPTAPKPKVAPKPTPAAPAPVAPRPIIPEFSESQVIAVQKRPPIGLIAGGIVVALVAVAAVWYLMRDKQQGTGTGQVAAVTTAVETPTPATGAPAITTATPTNAIPPNGGAGTLDPAAVPTRVRPTVPAGVPVATQGAGQPPVVTPTRVVTTTLPNQPVATPTPAAPEVTTPIPAIPTPLPQATQPPEPDPTPTAIVIGGSTGPITQPVVVRRITPAYPELAQRRQVKGRVELQYTVTETGTVEEIQVTSNTVRPDLGCERAAIEAMRQWRFTPATRNGVPTRTRETRVFKFGA